MHNFCINFLSSGQKVTQHIQYILIKPLSLRFLVKLIHFSCLQSSRRVECKGDCFKQPICSMARYLKRFSWRKLASVVYYVFYFCGLVYTGCIITSNIRSYFNYRSNISQRELEFDSDKVSFVPSRLCPEKSLS